MAVSTIQAQKDLPQVDYLSTFYNSVHIAIDSMWTYTAGGDSFDLSERGKLINTLYLTDSAGNSSTWNGIGWFRKTFNLPDSLIGKPLQLQIRHFGASEIYLDGELIGRNGVVGTSAKEEQIFVPRQPVFIVPDRRSHHVLMVKFSNHNADMPGNLDMMRGFWLQISPTSSSNDHNFLAHNHYIVSSSIVFGFCLFFLFVYLFYPDRMSSLAAGLWMLDYFLLFYSYYLLTLTTDGSSFLLISQIWQSSILMLNVFILFYYYLLYLGKVPRQGWLVFITMILLTSVNAVNGKIIVYFPLINFLFTIEFFRIIWSGIQRRSGKGFWILGIGQLAGSFLFLAVVANVFGIFSSNSISSTREIASIFVDLIYPLMLSLQLAWEFGYSNRSLTEQLVTVGQLSKENLEREVEKQHILSTQNEKLEQVVTERTANLNNSLRVLRSTQAQLIQSEKMASLGELTAGIAHEIQNPLNFVNNFSEVNRELIEELKSEIGNGNLQEVNAIIQDIESNAEKINHHGKRAEGIVKSMMQHSQKSSGKKKLSDLNALCDEYLRLAYHGMCAKDKNFNAALRTELDPKLPKINVVPQDIGRVLLNLINNAFQAISDVPNPEIIVSTKSVEHAIEISVADNGPGIPEEIKDKIFQPFFTTKPAGQGTGLGLSLSYDIVKAHNGTLEVHSTVGLGTDFTIKIPLA